MSVTVLLMKPVAATIKVDPELVTLTVSVLVPSVIVTEPETV